MAHSYGQYCPLALSAELLCQRWTVLIISRLIDGCTRFSEIQRGLPRISPALLSKRLTELEHVGILRATQGANGARTYTLTPAGRDLESIIDGMAVWGQHWARDMDLSDLDPAFLAWSMHTRMNVDAMPPGRTVIVFEFDNAPRQLDRFWIINDHGKVEMCLKDPGLDADLCVTSDLRLFVEAWRGIRDLRREIARGKIQLFGAEKLKRQFPDWLHLSALAPYARKRGGREKRLCSN